MIQKNQQTLSLFFSAGFLFFSGFMLVLNSILIPYIKHLHQLNYAQVNLIPFIFYFSYFFGAFLTSFMFKGQSFLYCIKKGILIEIVASFIMMSFGNNPPFYLVLFSTFLFGFGIAIIEVYGNPFLAKLGSERSISQRLILGHAATAGGMIFAPLFGTWLILKGNFLNIYVAIAIFGVALLCFTHFIKNEENEQPRLNNDSKNNLKSLKHKMVFLGFLGIATSVGIETCCSSFMIEFFSSHPQLNFDMIYAGNLSVIFWILLLLGRLVTPIFLYFFKEESLLKFHVALGLILVILVMSGSGMVILLASLGLGYAISIFFPLIFGMTLKMSDVNPSILSGVLCMGNIGGALYPFVQGVIADIYGIQLSFLIVMMGFLFLLYYIYQLIFNKSETFKHSTIDL